MFIAKLALLTSLIFSTTVAAQYSDYEYLYEGPSFSNYGTLGIINAPSARFHEAGTLGYNWSHNQPYLRGSLIAYPFDWFEASYQYTDINNYLYSPYKEFSGGQSFKDKSFDAKFRILQERNFLPAMAVGFRDIAGTGIFSSEYIVASKKIKNFDYSLGMGWGALSGGLRTNNPFSQLSDGFDVREYPESGEGGEFSPKAYFSGPAGFFGGLEFVLPFKRGLTISAEYDPINYDVEGLKKLKKIDSKWNFAFKYPLTNGIRLRLGITRGNTLNFSFSYNKNYSRRDPYSIKNDPPKKIENANIVRRVTSKDSMRAYKAALLYLSENNIALQTANIEGNKFQITYGQTKFFEKTRSLGRTLDILNQISPDYIDHYEITLLNADIAMFTAEIPRESFARYQGKKMHDPLLRDIKFYKQSNPRKNHEFRPPAKLPSFSSNFAPSMKNQVGGPDGFWFGQLDLSVNFEALITRALNISGKASVNIWNNFDKLKLESSSILPHVRTDVNRYLRQSRDKPYISNLQSTYFFNPSGSIYAKLSGGLLEQMFGGYGFEVLYRPFNSVWGIGVEAWRVKQRDYKGEFGFLDYETTTGHLSFYLREPNSGLFLALSGGRYLAEDSGFTVDLSRRFKSGMNLGVFFSLTDISKEEFGEGSFDKGFYFNMPVQIFFNTYKKDQTSFSFRPITRDGAARLGHDYSLWSITGAANKWKLVNDMDTIYD
jgi:hypothetical protein